MCSDCSRRELTDFVLGLLDPALSFASCACVSIVARARSRYGQAETPANYTCAPVAGSRYSVCVPPTSTSVRRCADDARLQRVGTAYPRRLCAPTRALRATAPAVLLVRCAYGTYSTSKGAYYCSTRLRCATRVYCTHIAYIRPKFTGTTRKFGSRADAFPHSNKGDSAGWSPGNSQNPLRVRVNSRSPSNDLVSQSFRIILISNTSGFSADWLLMTG